MALSRRDLEASIAAKAATDPAFRGALLTDARAALLSYFNVAVPSQVSVTVHEETRGSIHIVIPAPTTTALSDAELEAVSGGAHLSHGTAIKSSITPSAPSPIPIPYPNLG
jgi:hypothetical protein